MSDNYIVFPKECKKYFDLQCNGDLSLYTDMPEIKNIDKYLKDIKPNKVLDIGAGVGRASVYIQNRYKWKDTCFYLLDGDGGDVQYDELRTGNHEYYNSFSSAKIFCGANDLNIVQLNAKNDWYLNIVNSIDLVYSFLAIGFHWPINFYLRDIYKVSKKDSLIIFGIRGIEKKDWINKQVKNINPSKFKILELTQNKSKDRDSVLVLKKV
jgi:SAM-dependent methyltransferase